MVEPLGRVFGIVGVGFGIFLVVLVLPTGRGKLLPLEYKLRRLMIILAFSGAMASGVFWLLAMLIEKGAV